GEADENCPVCLNVAPLATPSSSGGGFKPPYTPDALNDGVGQATCAGYCWINNGATPSGAFFQYAWPSPQTIGSFYVDGRAVPSTGCPGDQAGGDIRHATVQYWDGADWVTAGSISDQEDYMFTFAAPIKTTRLRLYDVVTTAGYPVGSQIYEWYVYN